MSESGVDKAIFFVLILLAATVNVRLATLLPWRNAYARKYGCCYRDLALQRILRIHTASKMVEDLPQLTLAAIYLVHSSTAGGAAGGDAVEAVHRDEPLAVYLAALLHRAQLRPRARNAVLRAVRKARRLV